MQLWLIGQHNSSPLVCTAFNSKIHSNCTRHGANKSAGAIMHDMQSKSRRACHSRMCRQLRIGNATDHFGLAATPRPPTTSDASYPLCRLPTAKSTQCRRHCVVDCPLLKQRYVTAKGR
eukprot:6481563-Amphidinium_carterae.1